MTTRAEALRFIEDSRQPDLVPEITDRPEKFRRLGLKSDDRSIVIISAAVTLLPLDPVIR